MGSVELHAVPVDQRAALLEPLAALRLSVFAHYPYLYEGDLAYERAYLAPILETPSASLIAAFDGQRLVGAATGVGLLDHDPAFAAALEGRGLDLSFIYYCAESVLEEPYRGQGLGHGFFDLREREARAQGFELSAFCSVLRDGPVPDGFRPLDGFWRKRGYRPLDGAVARFSWRDRGAAEETEKPLQFWMRTL